MDPADESSKSCLDLVICSRNLRPYIKKLLIDSERHHAMKRVVYKNGKFNFVFADHFSLILYLENLPGYGIRNEKVMRWNLQKEGGWERYKELAEESSEKVIAIAEDRSKTVEEVVQKFEKISDNIKFKAFGKITIKDKKYSQDKSKENKDEQGQCV